MSSSAIVGAAAFSLPSSKSWLCSDSHLVSCSPDLLFQMRLQVVLAGEARLWAGMVDFAGRSARCELPTDADWILTRSHANHTLFPLGQCDTVTALLAAGGVTRALLVWSTGLTRGSHKGTQRLAKVPRIKGGMCCCCCDREGPSRKVKKPPDSMLLNTSQLLGKWGCDNLSYVQHATLASQIQLQL